MRRGTTPTLTFNLPFSSTLIQYCEVYFSQNDSLMLTKTMADCTLSGTQLSVTLTQAETLEFEAGDDKVEIQIRFVFTDDTVDATDIIKAKVKDILKDGEIEWQ